MSKINKVIYSILIILVVLFIILIIKDNFNKKAYSKEYNYFDEITIITIYKNNNDIFKKIDSLYKEYEQLINNLEDDNLKDLYYIENNDSNDTYITINKKLYNMIQYGLDIYTVTNGNIDISKDNYSDESQIKKIVLGDNYTILNNHIHINLNEIKEEYLNLQVEKLLKENNIRKYIINMDDTILVSSTGLKTGIPDPGNELSIIKTVDISNKCISTVNNMNEANYKSVTVQSKSNCESLAKMIMLDNDIDITKLDAKVTIYTKNKKFV